MERMTLRLPKSDVTRLKQVAKKQGVSSSAILRQIITAVVEVEGEEPAPKKRFRRVKKVTVTVDAELFTALETEAVTERVTPSTWAGVVLRARFMKSPQPVKQERRLIQKAFFQLQGIGRNINQITYAMNHGILVGEAREPTRQEVAGLREEVQQLRQELRRYAKGRYKFQTGNLDHD